MANIEDVAKKAGVSVTTVSRTLNNHPYVSKKTKDKIYRAMEDLEYYPNNVAQQLRGKRKKMIGVIISYITNPFFAYLVDAIEKTALEYGYTLVVLQTRGNQKLEKLYVELIPKKQLDGLIITNLENATPQVINLIKEGKIVLCNRYIGNKDIPVISIDEEKASYEGTKYLIDSGHKNIAFCTGNVKNTHDYRFKGFLKALNESNIPFDNSLFFEYILGVDGGRSFIKKFIGLENPPTAVFSNGDEVAAGIISEARKYSVKIPDDLAILGFDDHPLASLTNPEITTIHQPITDIGEISTLTLLANLEGTSLPEPKELETSIIIRETT
ncbi:LacI family DNA-binding transcriptional regulator [Vagococcus bubulae]|nr:LacI family DNA-binding transcriptional regulator [Vagococcus bubulae]